MYWRTCGDLLACFLHLHARLRVRSLHRHSLRPLFSEGAMIGKTRANPAAGRLPHILPPSCPGLTGASSIPQASRFSTTASGMLDRPVKPGDDSEVLFDN